MRLSERVRLKVNDKPDGAEQKREEKKMGKSAWCGAQSREDLGLPWLLFGMPIESKDTGVAAMNSFASLLVRAAALWSRRQKFRPGRLAGGGQWGYSWWRYIYMTLA